MKVPVIVKEFAVVAKSSHEALQEKTIPRVGDMYVVSELHSAGCQAFPNLYYVTVQLQEASDEATETRSEE